MEKVIDAVQAVFNRTEHLTVSELAEGIRVQIESAIDSDLSLTQIPGFPEVSTWTIR